MDSEENRIEQESLDFLTTCSVDDFVALYEHMTLCKLEELSDEIEIISSVLYILILYF